MKGYHQLPIGDQDRKLLLPGYALKLRPSVAERRLLQDKDGVSFVGSEISQRGHGGVSILDGPRDERDASRRSHLHEAIHLGLVRWKARIEQDRQALEPRQHLAEAVEPPPTRLGIAARDTRQIASRSLVRGDELRGDRIRHRAEDDWYLGSRGGRHLRRLTVDGHNRLDAACVDRGANNGLRGVCGEYVLDVEPNSGQIRVARLGTFLETFRQSLDE